MRVLSYYAWRDHHCSEQKRERVEGQMYYEGAGKQIMVDFQKWWKWFMRQQPPSR